MRNPMPSPKKTNHENLWIGRPGPLAAYDARLVPALEALRKFLVRLELDDASIKKALKLAAGEAVDDVQAEQPSNNVDPNRRLGMDSAAAATSFHRRFPGAARIGSTPLSFKTGNH